MKDKKIIGMFCLLTLLMVSPNISYGAEKSVAYLSLSDYTGPVAGIVTPGDMGAEDYFKYINEKGGIRGVKIRYITVDTRYDVARAMSAYKRYHKTPRLLITVANGTHIGKAIYPILERDKLIMSAPGDGEFVAKIGRTFITGQCYQDTFGAALDWMVKDWQEKGNHGKPIVGYIGFDSAAGREPLRGGKEYAEKIGVKLLKPEFFPMGSTDHTTYLTRLKSANYIYVEGADPSHTNVIRDAYRMGMTKNVQFVCDVWGPTMGVGVKAHPKELQRVVIVSYTLRGTDAHAHPLARMLWTKYRKKSISEMSPIYAAGLVMPMHFVAALEIALKHVGYKNIDGEAIYQAYQKLTGKDTTEGIQGPCTYSPTERRGSNQVRIYRIVDKKVVPISGWLTAPDTVSLHKF
ncbi:MAG: ABC transporter substrate-binding protein [Deltaproteobacteria bacterium]|nr:ABC transporter substrate-binding protein [Deltaproteobacteria bacterium]MBW2075344.1 ABC transporter substrate-binding protein [Deltaproteobacteria bacterium]